MNKEVLKLTETSILVALAILLHMIGLFVPLFQMPQGGFISLVLLPLVIVSLRHGYLYGFLSGIVAGIIITTFDGFVIHWGSLIFDYILAFGLVGITAAFKKDALDKKISKFILALTVASVIRYLMHSLSGVIFFSEFAEGKNVILYSFVLYNLPYLGISYLVSLIVGILIYPSLNVILKKTK
ncbi:MAG: energy-coupled thiamine transporter ThiT [Acholeplasmataceae bacterium]|jgi:thiamine transporter|nr:energy-coupled thiamine transporter ThiT [Acholeplasmataceae bacterium]